MEPLEELLAHTTSVTSEIVRKELMPALICFRQMIEGAALEGSLRGALGKIQAIYGCIVTQQAREDIQPRHSEALATLIVSNLQRGYQGIFNGLQRVVEVTYEGKPTSKATALQLFDVEARYLLEKVCHQETA